ncbi:MAG TPA: glycosyl transferase [Porphyromonadaceae bacterium]|nr:glycosyl transferase [Porphyromonadaceae bacterium]
MISIIIPVYNVEPYLHQCIDSILNQTYKDWECILVDDGSTDSSGVICDEYAKKDSRIHVLHTENCGASHARNIGIECANGEWISFVDADDWITKNYVESLCNIKDNVDLIYFPTNQIYEGEDIIIRLPKPETIEGRKNVEKKLYSLKYGYLGDIFGWTFAKFFKKSIIDKNNIRFVENIIFREDEIFTMDYCRYIYSIKVIDTPLYYYRVRNDGLTAKGMNDSDCINLADNIERNLPYFHNEEFLKKEKQRIADYHVEVYLRKYHLRSIYRYVVKCVKYLISIFH